MTAEGRPALDREWPVGFVVRPTVDRRSTAVEVADVLSGRRLRWNSEALATAVLRGDPAPQALTLEDTETNRQELLPGWAHWHKRGWRPSDLSYLASRRWHYVDTTDLDGSIRTSTLTEYLRREGQPPAEVLPSGPAYPLPEPAKPGRQTISELLVGRRSGRAYTSAAIELDRLSGLLWYGFTEVRARREKTSPEEPLSYLDSYGSAWDVHLCIYNVTDLPPGTYRYDLREHRLLLITEGDHRNAMIGVLQGMHSPATAAWTLGLVADFPRYQWRYRHEHALRRLYLEAGILAQELIILGSSYGLATLVTPAQKDRPYLRLHGLDDLRFACIYTLTMGGSRGRAGVAFNGNELDALPRRSTA
jgi:SagB-type dehydrogenase family enzyme